MLSKLRKLMLCFLAAAAALSITLPMGVQAEETTQQSEIVQPQLYSRYGYLMDMDTGQVLVSKAGEERMYPASMTKIMTIILAIDYLHDLDQTIPMTNEMLVGLREEAATCAGFRLGDTPTVRDCLYGAALPSGADASNALAVAVSGSLPAFIDLMNQKAKELGMTGTHFTNATGLHNEDHYSTCKDMATLMKYCMEHELFREIIAARTYKTGRLYTHYFGVSMRSSVWYYINIEGTGGYTIPGFEGGKTGYTHPAGRCMVSAATVNGMHLIGVVGYSLGATTHVIDTQTLYRWAGENYQQYTLAYAGTRLASINILDADPDENTIKVTLPDDVVYDLPAGVQAETKSEFIEQIQAPVEKGTELGSYKIEVGGETVYEMIFTAQKTYEFNNYTYYRNQIYERLGRYAFVPAALMLAFLLLILLFRMIRRITGKVRIRHRLEEREEQYDEEDLDITSSFQKLNDYTEEWELPFQNNDR